MEITQELLSMIIKHEGYRQFPYRCTANKLTIGYGHNLEDRGISENIAMLLLKEDIGIAIRDLSIVFPQHYIYSNKRKIALIDMIFNMGLPVMKGFKNMIKAVDADDWERAADEIKNSLWYNQVGNRAKEIEKMIREGDI